MINFINYGYNNLFMHKKRGQISFEYMTIIGFGMLILLVGVYLFYNYSMNSNDSYVISRIDDFGKTLTKNAEILYYSTGEGSAITLETNIPSNVKEIYFFNRTEESELVIGYNLRRGYTESVYFIPIRMRGIYSYAGTDKTIPFSATDKFHVGTLKLQVTKVSGGIKVEEAT